MPTRSAGQLKKSRAETATDSRVERLPVVMLRLCPELSELYESSTDSGELAESMARNGLLTPVLVEPISSGYQVIAGSRRLAAAKELGWREIAAVVRQPASDDERRWWILASNQQRAKRFSDRMREADLMERLVQAEAKQNSLANLERGRGLKIFDETRECLNSDIPANSSDAYQPIVRQGVKAAPKRSDTTISAAIGLGGKDLYRQARAIWLAAKGGDDRAGGLVAALDSGTKTIYAAFKDLRRRDHLATDFQPSPYDFWSFKHDRSYGMDYPGSIPAGIVANTVYYYSQPGDLVIDPMAGGGTTIDVCKSLGRRCHAYDIKPSRQEIRQWNIAEAPLPEEARGCDLVFLDPPYFSMLREQYDPASVSANDTAGWIEAMTCVYQNIYAILRPGGVFALLIANQTGRDVPADEEYIDHAFEAMNLIRSFGFKPIRRISCPMQCSYRPDEINMARQERKLLGQVRDLLVFRKTS